MKDESSANIKMDDHQTKKGTDCLFKFWFLAVFLEALVEILLSSRKKVERVKLF